MAVILPLIGYQSGSEGLLITALLLVTVGEVWALVRFSPAQRVPVAAVMVGLVNLTGIFGYFFYRRIQFSAAVSASLPSSQAIYNSAAKYFTLVTLAVAVGGLITIPWLRRAGDISTRSQSASKRSLRAVLDGRTTLFNLISVISIVTAFVALTPPGVLYRDQYGDAPGVAVINRILALALCVGLFCAVLSIVDRAAGLGTRLFAVTFAIGNVLMLLSKDTRLISAVPSIVLIGRILSGRPFSSSARVAWGAGLFMATYVLLPLPLNLRSLPHAGLAPYLTAIASRPAILLSFNYGQVFGNILFSVPLTGFVSSDSSPLAFRYFVTSIDPRPSQYTNWAALSPQLRINGNTPFSGAGELARYGVPVLVAYLVVATVLLSLCQAASSRRHGLSRTIGDVVALACGSLFAVNLLQYNLRSATRFVWYALFICTILIPLLTFLSTALRRTRVSK